MAVYKWANCVDRKNCKAKNMAHPTAKELRTAPKIKVGRKNLEAASPCEKCGGPRYYSEKWWIRLRIKGELYDAPYSTSLKETLDREQELIHGRNRGQIRKRPTRFTVADAAEVFKESQYLAAENGTISESTAAGTVSHFRPIVAYNSSMLLVDWDKSAAQLYTAYRKKQTKMHAVPCGNGKYKLVPVKSGKKVSASQINHELQVMTQVQRLCLEKGLIPYAPILGAKRHRLPDGEDRTNYLILDPENGIDEVQKVLDVCRKPNASTGHKRSKFLYIKVLIAINTGLRIASLYNLKWSNLDLEKGLLFDVLVKSRRMKPKRVSFELPKVVQRKLIEWKRDQMNDMAFMRKVGGIRGLEKNYVFPHDNDPLKPWNPKTDHGFKRAIREAGILDRVPNFTFHDLRHTFATINLEFNEKATFKTLSEWMGHTAEYMTHKYAHVTRRSLRQVSERMDFGFE